MLKRKDATLISEVDPFHSIVPYVMPKRTEAECCITQNFDITALEKFIDKYNKTATSKLKLFHCVCYAAGKMIYLRPKMNIFIAGRKFWQRKDITLSFVAKQKFEDHAEEVLMFLKTQPEWTIKDISTRINGDVQRAKKEGSNDLTGTMDFVGKLPRPILSILFWVLSRLEYHGIMPESLSKGDPNYSTMLLSNLGSIGASSAYHHLSNYGTCSLMGTIGKTFVKNGKTYCPMTVTLDERIADGFYFAKSLKLVHYIFEHPETLLDEIQKEIPFDFDAKEKKKVVKKKSTSKKK